MTTTTHDTRTYQTAWAISTLTTNGAERCSITHNPLIVAAAMAPESGSVVTAGRTVTYPGGGCEFIPNTYASSLTTADQERRN